MKTVSDVLREIRPEFDSWESEDFISDGMLDSHDLVMLISELEKLHRISIAGVDIVPANFNSIASIERLVQKYSQKP